MLLGIILFPLSMGFSLICRMRASQIIHDRPLGRADWAFSLGRSQGPGCFIGRASTLVSTSGPVSPFFKPYQYLLTIFLSSFIPNIIKIYIVIFLCIIRFYTFSSVEVFNFKLHENLSTKTQKKKSLFDVPIPCVIMTSPNYYVVLSFNFDFERIASLQQS